MALKDIKPKEVKSVVLTFRASKQVLTQLKALQKEFGTTRQRIFEEAIAEAYEAYIDSSDRKRTR